jgi:hypothetical protein
MQPWWVWGSIGLAALLVLALLGWLAVNFVK